MLSYEEIKTKPKTLQAMTSLKQEEFADEWNKAKGQVAGKGGLRRLLLVMQIDCCLSCFT